MNTSNSGPARRIGIGVGGILLGAMAACATGSEAIYGGYDGAVVVRASPDGASDAPSSSSGSGGPSTAGSTSSGSGASSGGTVGGNVRDDAGVAGGDAGKGDDAASCSPSCNGCCDPNLGCAPGTDDTACGMGGAACQDCTTSSQLCQRGACGASSGTSSGSSASGSSGTTSRPDGGGGGCNALACLLMGKMCMGGVCR